jgi:UDP-N-acetyl-alpha-D-muramoyl-L-alanyl-L-glutamate epimerase
MKKYAQFSFDSYNFDVNTGKLTLHYGLDDKLHFTETYFFDFTFSGYDPAVLDRAIQSLFFMAGVSYYKTYIPEKIVIHKGQMDTDMAAFFGKTYQKGLGEFWFVNNLDPQTPVVFPATTAKLLAPKIQKSSGLLVGLGGGKDSLVTVEMLRHQHLDIATWSLNHRPQLTPLVERIGLPHFWVEREWDPQLFSLGEQDALNGHVPISAIFACVGVIVAILSGRKDVVVSNEHSANEATLLYKNTEINHQYSKSQAFEKDFQLHLAHLFGEDNPQYYSFLRPFSELRIAEIFAQIGFKRYKDVFSSCNRAFVHGSNSMSWCGECSKCAFVFLALTPFIKRCELEDLWGGKNLLLDKNLEPIYQQLLGIKGQKPLDCVGEIKESRQAMRLAQQKYPELRDIYHFDLPINYNFRKLYPHEMPTDIFTILHQVIANLAR